jgi:hypothetical protein
VEGKAENSARGAEQVRRRWVAWHLKDEDDCAGGSLGLGRVEAYGMPGQQSFLAVPGIGLDMPSQVRTAPFGPAVALT